MSNREDRRRKTNQAVSHQDWLGEHPADDWLSQGDSDNAHRKRVRDHMLNMLEKLKARDASK
jgi:hypothetical protein